jgi:hypothetical protein
MRAKLVKLDMQVLHVGHEELTKQKLQTLLILAVIPFLSSIMLKF